MTALASSARRERTLDVIHRAGAHSMRRALLNHLDAGPDSPTGFAQSAGIPHQLSVVSYHVRRLLGWKMIRLARRAHVRGAVEHFYELTPTGRVAQSVIRAAGDALKDDDA